MIGIMISDVKGLWSKWTSKPPDTTTSDPELPKSKKEPAVPKFTKPVVISPSDVKLRKTYENLFHELQFRASKNALMNYYQAEVLDEKSGYMKAAGGAMAAASSAGILASIVQKGKMLASRFGMAGVVGMPVCAAMELFSNCSSDFLPSHQEHAKKHTQAAAAWNRISDRSRAARLRLQQDKMFTPELFIPLHDELIADKEKVQKSVVLPRELHRQFNADAESVFASIKRRKETFKKFKEYHYNEKDFDEGDEEDDSAYYL